MNIGQTQPPSNIDPELQRWLAQLLIEISGALQDVEKNITDLQKEVKAIKTHLGLT